jgi:hypothetical protein
MKLAQPALSLFSLPAKTGMLARIFHRIAGWWRVDLRADLRIPRQANSQVYWREAGVQRCRKSAANAREGRRYKLESGLIARKAFIPALLRHIRGRSGEISGLACWTTGRGLAHYGSRLAPARSQNIRNKTFKSATAEGKVLPGLHQAGLKNPLIIPGWTDYG